VNMGTQRDSAFTFLNKIELLKLKTKAMRSGVWFRALQRIDRVLIDLTIKVADTVRSPKLAKSILSLTRKLETIMESGFSRACRAIGLPLAQKISIFAQKLGNASAKSWATDPVFAIYLAAMHLSGTKIFR
jgi:hypothetical protein